MGTYQEPLAGTPDIRYCYLINTCIVLGHIWLACWDALRQRKQKCCDVDETYGIWNGMEFVCLSLLNTVVVVCRYKLGDYAAGWLTCLFKVLGWLHCATLGVFLIAHIYDRKSPKAVQYSQPSTL